MIYKQIQSPPTSTFLLPGDPGPAEKIDQQDLAVRFASRKLGMKLNSVNFSVTVPEDLDPA